MTTTQTASPRAFLSSTTWRLGRMVRDVECGATGTDSPVVRGDR